MLSSDSFVLPADWRCIWDVQPLQLDAFHLLPWKRWSWNTLDVLVLGLIPPASFDTTCFLKPMHLSSSVLYAYPPCAHKPWCKHPKAPRSILVARNVWGLFADSLGEVREYFDRRFKEPKLGVSLLSIQGSQVLFQNQMWVTRDVLITKASW